MTQKRFLPILLLMVALSVLTACNPSPAATSTGQPTETAKPSTSSSPATAAPIPSEPVKVRWYIGLGAGTDPDAIDSQLAIVDEFNASQDKIELIFEFIGGVQHYDTLEYILTEGEAPDLVGPMGIRGRDSFKGEWLDLQPLIDASGYDMSVYDPAMVRFFQVKGEGQLNIPFAIFPSFIFVNKDLFDKAGLPYPPQKYGAPYVDENGEAKPWNTDTLRELAMKLTLDAQGNNATSPYFAPENVVQFGYFEGLTDMRGALTLFGSGSFVAEDGKTAQIPEQWREGMHWVYDAMWKDHFWPTDAYMGTSYNPSNNDIPFQSGNTAMMHCHTWFAAEWSLGNVDFAWDTAAVPSYNGQVTAKMHADTFGILKKSRHPREAFEVLTYLLSEEVSARLLEVYGGMPARVSQQEGYLKTYGETVFPGQSINWQVVLDSIQYADHPNHESWTPSFSETRDAYSRTWTRLAQEPNLDVDAELDTLQKALQTIFDAAEE